MPNQIASPLQVLASVTHTSNADWEDLAGPDSGVGVDYWYRHRGSGAEAYLNRDQDRLTVSVDGGEAVRRRGSSRDWSSQGPYALKGRL
jgi:hypothetical protein